MIRQLDRDTTNRRAVLFLTLLMLLAGCNLGPSDVMKESFANQYGEVSDFRLQQQTPWQEGGVALVTFNAVSDHDLTPGDCSGISYFKNSAEGYTVFTSVSSCGNTLQVGVSGDEAIALETIPDGNLALVELDTSVAFGLVNHPEGAQVRVEWRDGKSKTVKVINRSYLAPRRGFSDVKVVTLLDQDGNLLAVARL